MWLFGMKYGLRVRLNKGPMIFVSTISHGPISSLYSPPDCSWRQSYLIPTYVINSVVQVNLANGLRQATCRMQLPNVSLAVWRDVQCMWFHFQWDPLAAQSQRMVSSWPILLMWSYQWTSWPEWTNRFWMRLAILMISSSVSTQLVVRFHWNAN